MCRPTLGLGVEDVLGEEKTILLDRSRDVEPLSAARTWVQHGAGADDEPPGRAASAVSRTTANDHQKESNGGELRQPGTGPIGTTVGNIRIEARLGEGGMGDVYAGYDNKLRRWVAVKAIRSDRLNDSAKARFRREARILSQLDDPKICRIYDYIDGDSSDLLILELVEGKTLGQHLREGLQPSLRLPIAEQVAEVLVAAHGNGVVHRDLKPDNVMLTPDGDVKVLDFGLAYALGESENEDESSYSDTLAEFHTQRGSVVGTLSYMSPEQARGEAPTAASDMFSFGLLLQELFTGRSPYESGLSTMELLIKAARGESRPVEGVAREVSRLIVQLKRRAPASRPSAAKVLKGLRRFRDRRQRRMGQLIAAAVVLSLIAGVAKYTHDLRGERNLAISAQNQSEAARQTAEQARSEAEEVARFLVGLFEVSNPGQARGNSITARELLASGAAKVATDLADQPLTQATMMDTIGRVYRELGLYEQARPLLKQALAQRQELLGPDHPSVAHSLNHLGTLLLDTRRPTEAESHFQRALGIWELALGPDHPDLARALRGLGRVRLAQDRPDQAKELLGRALAIRAKAFGPDHPATLEIAAEVENWGTPSP